MTLLLVQSTDKGPVVRQRINDIVNEINNTPVISDHGLLTGLADDDHTQYHTDTRADTWLGTKSVNALSDVTITTPTTGQVLKYNGTSWINDTDGGGGSVTTFNSLEVPGVMYTGVISSFRAVQGGTMAKFSAYLETAPTGSSFTIDLKINGITQATATITAGTNSGNDTTFTSSTLTEGDLVEYEITAIGSTVAGSDLTVGLTLS